MNWRVPVIDEDRFCIVGTMDLTFDECRQLSDRKCGNMVKIVCRELLSVGSFEVEPMQMADVRTQWVRGQHFYKRDDDGEKRILHVVVRGDPELDGLRRTGRFREWDADIRTQQSS